MSYRTFVSKTTALARREGYTVSHSREDGRFFARFSDGHTMTGNSYSKRVAIMDKYRQHTFYAVL